MKKIGTNPDAAKAVAVQHSQATRPSMHDMGQLDERLRTAEQALDMATASLRDMGLSHAVAEATALSDAVLDLRCRLQPALLFQHNAAD